MLIAVIIFVVLLCIGMPVGMVIAISSLSYFFTADFLPIGIAFQKFSAPTQSFPILATPLFLLVGNLLNKSGVTGRLLDFARVISGWMIGGLAQINVLLACLLGGVSGSATADAAMQARVLGLPMVARGYPKAFSAVVIAFSSLITATIPPSILMILYGFVGNVSIGKLFMAGIFPGLLLTAILMLTNYLLARKMNIKPETASLPGRQEVWRSFKESFWALMFPVVLIVVIRLGIFTTTEAGAFIVLYSFIIGRYIYKALDNAVLWEVLKETINDVGVVMLLIMSAAILGHITILDQIPQQLAETILAFTENKYGILFLLLALIAVAGMLFDGSVIILLLTPILLPIAIEAGFDPIHFGMIFVVLTLLGANTPPVGICMYTVCGILNCSSVAFVRASLPYLIAFLSFIILLVIFPQIALFLPSLLM
ncbi:TRAP transporter large permease [Escherichia fergusonii]|uniref:TRAP transporter large permease n=1 Tax=Escherichia fergusonii TaxID=564 RepID=UPI0001FB61C3|nr:TRAP transporter large permease [Escherichia fergusonii]EFL4508301.1 TRAP transporter large permease [Escherichia fergusonii]EFL4515005.1 TRAP transporter large permease [Escherichia fergusonii]EFN0217073.1 TRAP transporter large permease [Escherichia fergusonii]EFO7693100.1 TRAP transporter large permease [Escherichia fergusonii]EGC07263.1 TRAP transporter [Escherichia fergusonii B253]